MSSKELTRHQSIQKYLSSICAFDDLVKLLDVGDRQARRLVAQVRNGGPQALIHGLRGKPSNHRLKPGKHDNSKALIAEKYSTFKPTFVSEKLDEIHSIRLSDETVRKLMTDMGYWKPKVRKEQRMFALRERSGAYGIMIQFDGSYHEWLPAALPGVTWCLLVAIDDATGQIPYAQFVDDEGIADVFPFWRHYLLTHGVPESVYCDRFSTYKSNHPEAPDVPTQFGRVCKTFGIDLVFALTPQAKGRVERVNQTLQDRLVSEMKLADITTREEANAFLQNTYLPKHNKKFARVPRSEHNMHRTLRDEERAQLETIFSIHFSRKIMNDFTISFNKQIYQIHAGGATVWRGEQVRVEQRLSGEIVLSQRDKPVLFTKIGERPEKGYKLPLPPRLTSSP